MAFATTLSQAAFGALVALVPLTLTPAAHAADGQWPSQPVSMLVPAAAGGTTDLAARMLADPLSQELGQPVVVENRAGGSGAIAAQAVKRANPDGYTLLMQYSGYHTITPHVSRQQLPWTESDFRPVANVLSAPQVIVVRSSLPVRTLAELVSAARAQPGKLSYASSGNGSLQHVTGALLEKQAGVKLVHVPYRGTGPAVQDLVGNQVDMTFGTPPPYMPFIQGGQLRAIAVTGRERLPSLPDVPTTAEAGMPDLNPSSWFAVFAPAKTSDAVVERLSKAVQKVVDQDSFREKARQQGAEADYRNAKGLGTLVQAESRRWAEVARDAGIKAE